MPWIESHQSLARHPKTRKLAFALSITTLEAVGILHHLWWWAMDYAQDGDLSRFEDDEIGIAAGFEEFNPNATEGFTGTADEITKALIKTGWLDEQRGHRAIHDWWDYAGRFFENQEKASKGGAFGNHKRWHEKRGVVDELCEFCHPESDSESPSESGGDIGGRSGGESHLTQPNQTVPNPTEPNLGAAKTKEARAKKLPSDWEPPDDLRSWAQEKTPAVSVDAELEKFRDHFTATGKPMKDWNAAFRNWLRRAPEFSRNGSPRVSEPEYAEW